MPKGVRYGGKPKGYKAPATIDKELKREERRQLIIAHLRPMVEAQVEHAKGVSYMILRNADGTFTRATDEKQIDAACAVGASAFKIFTQAPNVQAYARLSDEALDKPAESKQEIDVNLKGDSDLLAALMAGRERARKVKP